MSETEAPVSNNQEPETPCMLTLIKGLSEENVLTEETLIAQRANKV